MIPIADNLPFNIGDGMNSKKNIVELDLKQYISRKSQGSQMVKNPKENPAVMLW